MHGMTTSTLTGKPCAFGPGFISIAGTYCTFFFLKVVYIDISTKEYQFGNNFSTLENHIEIYLIHKMPIKKLVMKWM